MFKQKHLKFISIRDKLKGKTLNNTGIMVSFNIKSFFTNIPMYLANKKMLLTRRLFTTHEVNTQTMSLTTSSKLSEITDKHSIHCNHFLYFI